MSISDGKIVDALTLEEKERKLVLRIFDHLSWDDEIFETHLTALQNKLNDYLDFITTKQVDEYCDPEKYDQIIIFIVAMYPYNEKSLKYFNIAKRVITSAGYDLIWELDP